MELALDGAAPPSYQDEAVVAEERADQDTEMIQLALRGLPVFPAFPPTSSSSSSTPEAAFIVSGGPACFIRDVLLSPYHHPSAPPQLYAAIDTVRKLQNRSDFKSAIRTLNLVFAVWTKKHLWKLLAESPDFTLADILEDDIRRTEESRLKIIYREEQRLKKEEEEREAARKAAEKGEDGEESSSDLAAAAAASSSSSHPHSKDDDSDEEDDEFDEDEDEEAYIARRIRRKKKHEKVVEQVIEEAPKERHPHDAPDEIFEFPEVTPEQELEFLVFYYNLTGSIYASAASCGCPAGQRMDTMMVSGGDGRGGVRWGKMKVIPVTVTNPQIRHMMLGTQATTMTATQLLHHAAEFSIPTTVFMDEGMMAEGMTNQMDENEQYIASSPTDLSNSSDARALIALWQAKRAHDLYVDMKEAEAAHRRAIEREKELALKGKGSGDEDDAGGAEESMESHGGNNPDAAKESFLGNSSVTTLSHPGFANINIPNLSLATLQAETKQMGLFGFPMMNSLTVTAASGGSKMLNSQHQQERQQNFLFWSTQPLIIPAINKLATAGLESNKNFASTSSTNSLNVLSSLQSLALAAQSSPANGPPQQLINPYILCSTADAITYSNLGATLFSLGNYPLSLRCFYVALQIRVSCVPPTSDEYIDVGSSLNNLGVIFTTLNYYAEAWNYFSAASELLSSRLDAIHPRMNTISNNLLKIQSRRQGVLNAPGLLQQLRNLASAKEKKEAEAREKRLAKANKKGKNGKATPSGQSARKMTRGGKPEPVPIPFHEDIRYFQAPVAGAVVVPPAAPEGTPPPPLGSAAAAIKIMPLRQWDVAMSETQKLMVEFGPAKKKEPKDGGKKSKKKK